MTTTAEARKLLQQGRVPEAEKAYEHVLLQSPDDIEALNVVALAALRASNTRRAIELLQHAATIDPAHAPTQFHLGQVQEAAGGAEEALKAYRAAVRLQPDLHVARLHLGAALERARQPELAVIHYARAMQDAHARGRWLNAQTTGPALRPMVEHAVRTVRKARWNTFERIFEPLAARYGRSELKRVEQCLRIYLKEEAPVYPDPRQKPTFLFFPGLPATAYLDRSLFPWIERLEPEAPAIREELLALLPSSRGRERVFTSDELEQQNLRGIDAEPSWNGYYFYRYGERRDDNCASCPATAQALEQVPLARVREHAPEVLYSVFTPGTHLLPHRGVTNTRLVGHLPLIVPEDCALSVGGEVHVWQEGRVVVFDDTYEHEAWNRSRQTRVVLIFDLWNPHLTEPERLAVAELVGEIGDFRKAVEAA